MDPSELGPDVITDLCRLKLIADPPKLPFSQCLGDQLSPVGALHLPEDSLLNRPVVPVAHGTELVVNIVVILHRRVLSGCGGGQDGEQEVPDLTGFLEMTGAGGPADPLLGVVAVMDREVAPPQTMVSPYVVILVGGLNPD